VTAFLRLEDRDGKQAFLPSSYTPTASAGGDSKKAQIVEVDPKTEGLRRVLYCANAGDARGVLCRGGKAVRLTYDHKGSDKQEAKRITDAGGFMLGGRVNGVLAVTRSLGDSAMKDYVVGAPYTTETELCEEDEFMIIACDGVCFSIIQYALFCVGKYVNVKLTSFLFAALGYRIGPAGCAQDPCHG
jgi:protein phosphatase PTC1